MPHIIPAAVMVATRLVVDPLDPWILLISVTFFT
jgi:hypothetical protein